EVWVIFLLPIVLAYLTRRPEVPIILTLLATVFIVVGYVLSPAGAVGEIAIYNRAFGVFSAWVMGIVGYFFIKNKVAILRQEWLQTGEVGLNQAIAGELGLNQLGENVLGFLAGYLNATAGVIFIQNGEGFARKATYATPAEAGIPEHGDVDDGLLGQSIKDGRSFVVRDLPNDYLYFGSAMGRAKPQHTLIAPVKADGVVNGVIELGFAHELDPSYLELLERVSPAIAVAVRSAK